MITNLKQSVSKENKKKNNGKFNEPVALSIEKVADVFLRKPSIYT